MSKGFNYQRAPTAIGVALSAGWFFLKLAVVVLLLSRLFSAC